MEALLGLRTDDAPTVGYARVSSHDQKADLERQHAALEAYCAAKGWRSYVIKDLGSGMNYGKKGLQELLELILRRRIRPVGADSQRPPSPVRCGVGVRTLRTPRH